MNNRTGKERKKGLSPSTKLFLAILPSIIVCFLYSYRSFWGLGYAFVDYKLGRNMLECDFVGLKWFKSMFANAVKRREMFRILRNTVAMSTIGLVTSFVPMFVAVLLNEIPSKRCKRVTQSLITIPNFIGWVTVYATFYALLAPGSGIIAGILRNAGLIKGNFELMTSADYGWFFMWILGMWKSVGWSTIIYLSAISSIDQELYEAAEIDGAGRFQKMRYITVPLLMPTFITLVILSVGNFLSSDFDKIFVFSNAFNRSTVETIDLYVYDVGMVNGNYSFSTAVGLMKSIVGLGLMWFANTLSKKIRGQSLF